MYDTFFVILNVLNFKYVTIYTFQALSTGPGKYRLLTISFWPITDQLFIDYVNVYSHLQIYIHLYV
jgi:hypothetical protein